MVNGTLAEPVQFLPNSVSPYSGFWGGIVINSSGEGKIDFAEISYAKNGIFLNQSTNSFVNSTTIKYCSITGILCNGTNNILIQNNSISENIQNGLELLSVENTTIKNNTINANAGGIYFNLSKNNNINNNSLSNRVQNTYDEDTNYVNTWIANYYNDYMGVDTNRDFFGDGSDYGIGGGGFNRDALPRTKIFNNKNIDTYASLAKAVLASTANMEIYVPAITPFAGTQTLPQLGYYYENILIGGLIKHDLNIFGPGLSGFKNTTIDGDFGTFIEVDGNYKLTLAGLTIKNSDTAVRLRNGATNSYLHHLSITDNIQGIKLDSTSGVIISDNSFDNNYGNGSLMIKDSINSDVFQNYINNSESGIIIQNSDNNIIHNNSINSNVQSGMFFNHSSNNTVKFNEIGLTEQFGLILLNGSDNNSFLKNQYLNNNDGIKLNTSVENIFTNSKIIANARWGIYFESNAMNNTFKGIGTNNFQGNDVAIHITNGSRENLFINSTIGSSNVLPLWMDENSSIIFLNSILNENTVVIVDKLSNMTMAYYLTIQTVNKTDFPLTGAAVQVYDNKSNLIISGLTNILGELALIPCIYYIRNQSARDYSSNDHYIYANDSLTIQMAVTNMSSTKTIVFKFNYIPTILTVDNLTAVEKVFYSVIYNASNLEPDKNLTWELETNTSSWLQLDAVNATIYGTPHNRDVGRPWVRVIAKDIDGDKAENYFLLNITNTPPTIITPDQLTVFEDEDYYVNYNSTDDDGILNETGVIVYPPINLTSWRIQNKPQWLMFDNDSGVLNGIPDNSHVGKFDIDIFLDDGHGGKNSTSFTLEVINTPPEIITEDIPIAYKNIYYYNDYNSSDDGLGNMTWGMNTNANWLTLNTTTGVLNGTPFQTDVGLWWVNISVTDNHGGKTNYNFTINVIDLNMPPLITTENVLVAYANQLYSVQYEATDQDTPIQNLTWELGLDTNARWLTMDLDTGLLSGTPQLERHLGEHFVNVTVRDNEGGRAFTTFNLTVIKLPNAPPKFLKSSLIPDDEVTIDAFKTWSHTFEANDDYTPKENLTWTLNTSADWLSIDRTTGRLIGTPQPEHEGRYAVEVNVIDEEGLVNTTLFSIIVRHENHAPRLNNAGMTPINGSEDDWFTFYVTYTDQDNDSGSVSVVIDNRSYLMKVDTSTGLNYHLGVNYTFRIKLKPGTHTYYFSAKDAYGKDAKIGRNVPNEAAPAQTYKIKKVIHKEFYEDPWCWISGIIIIIILLCILQFVLKPISRRYNKLTFVQRITLPDKINPVVRSKLREEREASGELGFLCPNCKTIVDDDAVECENCGEQFMETEYLCPDCDAEVSGTDIFCPKCGSKFDELEQEPELESEDELPEEEPDMDVSDLEEDSEPGSDEEFEPEEEKEKDSDADEENGKKVNNLESEKQEETSDTNDNNETKNNEK
jgi:parallel beta-helix repeat protein